ncbi:hypothetical protein G7046_g3890 [Stylonectria norvegica]|nr:hypothetical protein G7046_g3890 [Stylonectria norvegica]
MAEDIFEFREAIIRVCSYHRRDCDLVLVRSQPDEMQIVQESLQTAFETASPNGTGLGNLDRLPPELIDKVLYNLDILSYFRFRQVNRPARVIATDQRDYALVAKHGLEGLRSLLRTKLAHHFTVADLHLPLITENCLLCGAFGGFLFLPTAMRCCFACIRASRKLRMVCPSVFAAIVGMPVSRLLRLIGPLLCPVPGTYSWVETSIKLPKYLIAEQQASETLASLDLLSKGAEYSISSRKQQGSRCFMAATAFPWYDQTTAKTERGISCRGCRVRSKGTAWHKDRDRVFSTTSFLTHFTSCTEAQALWTESRSGTVPVEEPRFTRLYEHFKLLDKNGRPR